MVSLKAIRTIGVTLSISVLLSYSVYWGIIEPRNDKIDTIIQTTGMSKHMVESYRDVGVDYDLISAFYIREIDPDLWYDLQQDSTATKDDQYRVADNNIFYGNDYVKWAEGGFNVETSCNFADYGINNLEDAIAIKKRIGIPDLSKLIQNRISADESIPLMLEGKSVDTIVTEYLKQKK